MLIITILVAFVLVFIGWGVHKKKWYFLISGYNMMSKEEKQKVDVENLAKSLAKMAYIMAMLIILLGIFNYYELSTLSIVTTISFIVVPITFIIRSNKYMKNARSPRTKKITIIITTITLAFVTVVLVLSLKQTIFTVENESLTISGMYGDTIAFVEMTNVQLLEEMPKIELRTNGSAIGTKLKGHFKFEGGEKAKLFLDKSKPPFIKIETKDTIYYLNDVESKKTEALYKQLKK